MSGSTGPGELIPPGAGAVVMGTGIVSLGLATDGALILSRILLALASLVWLALAAVAGFRLAFRRRRFRLEAASPAGLTGVAGTAVLGSTFGALAWPGVAIALLLIAAAAAAALLPLVVRNLPRHGSGQLLMVVVAIEAVASLAAVTAADHRARWLVYVALVLVGAGVLAYPPVAIRVRMAEATRGQGDQWILGGALAIASLAAADVARAALRLDAPPGAGGALGDLALGLWIAAALWIGPLLAGELAGPRPAYRAARWATVFPLGMYAESGFTVARAAAAGGLADFARVWIWVAVAVWGATLVGLVRRALRLITRRSG